MDRYILDRLTQVLSEWQALQLSPYKKKMILILFLLSFVSYQDCHVDYYSSYTILNPNCIIISIDESIVIIEVNIYRIVSCFVMYVMRESFGPPKIGYQSHSFSSLLLNRILHLRLQDI